MKHRNTENVRKTLCSMLLQVLALAGVFISKGVGAGILILSILYTGICMAVLRKQNQRIYICDKCGMEFPEQYRVCPNCGNACEKMDMERDLAKVMEDENEREPEETPEELERNFARIEEMDIEKALALEEEDIEDLLTEKNKNDDRIGI